MLRGGEVPPTRSSLTREKGRSGKTMIAGYRSNPLRPVCIYRFLGYKTDSRESLQIICGSRLGLEGKGYRVQPVLKVWAEMYESKLA